MQVAFKTYFLQWNIWFKYVSSIFYQREGRFVFLWDNGLCVINFIHVYFIKVSNKNVGLNTTLTNWFQTYLFPTFIIPKFLKICKWFIINTMEGSIVSKWNLNNIWIYFLLFSWKTASFWTWYFFDNFF
jgi:hypothetical protein